MVFGVQSGNKLFWKIGCFVCLMIAVAVVVGVDERIGCFTCV